MWKETAVAKYHVSPNISALFSRETSFTGIGVHIGIQISQLGIDIRNANSSANLIVVIS